MLAYEACGRPGKIMFHSDSKNNRCRIIPSGIDSHSDRPIVGDRVS